MTAVPIKEPVGRSPNGINTISDPGPAFTRASRRSLEHHAHRVIAEAAGAGLGRPAAAPYLAKMVRVRA